MRSISAAILANAQDVSIRDTTFSINTITPSRQTLEILYQRVATNAIRNKGGRADDPKCHPGMHTEDIGLIEKWMDNVESDRIFWMSGPAGRGKTAIMKTITERSPKRGVTTINFFFFRGDSTRNNVKPLVATLLYQLFRLYPSTVEVVAEICSIRPRILDESIEDQCELLSALSPIIRQQSSTGAPIFLLVDGLDECNADADAELSQVDILCALERLVMEHNSPFRLLIASRHEAHIQMAFDKLLSNALF